MTEYIVRGVWQLIYAMIPATIAYIFVFFLLQVKNKKNSGTVSKLQYISGYFLMIYLFAILNITGVIYISYHLDGFSDGLSVMSFGIPFLGKSFKMIVLNTVLFIPYGFLFTLFFKKINLKGAFFIGLGTTACIEFLQLFTGRLFEIDDLISNTLGSLIGYLLCKVCFEIFVMNSPKNGIKKLTYILIGSVLYLSVLFFLANGDQLQEEEYAKYTEMTQNGQTEEISKVVIYRDKKSLEIGDPSVYEEWYRQIGTDISNMCSQYQQQEKQTDMSAVLEENSDLFIEIWYQQPQNFTFYNNPELVINAASHILYNLDTGALYYEEQETSSLAEWNYRNEEYPFLIDEDIYEEIKTYE